MNKSKHTIGSDLETNNIDSPCIRHCCLNEDDVCLGCYRTLEEILAWNSMTPIDKQQVLTLCKDRKKPSNRL
ncbi:DUF1289 domain-containing protein [Vibrio lamellibrachiae]